jgi:hypothetical protein
MPDRLVHAGPQLPDAGVHQRAGHQPSGNATLFGGAFPWPVGIAPGTKFYFQWVTLDSFPALTPLSTSNAIIGTTP